VVDTSATLDIFSAIRHATTIRVATAGSRQSFESMICALEVNSTRPIVDRVFSFDQVREAFAHLAAGGHFGKVVIAVP